MTTDRDTTLPRWGGVTEPMTVLTNVILGGVAFVLGIRLTYTAAAEGVGSAGALGLGFLATAFAATLGAAAHGLDPVVDRFQRDRCWKAALYVTGLAGAASVAAVAYFAVKGPVRTVILVAAGLKLLVYFVSIARRPEFRVAAADYGGGLAVLLGGAAYTMTRWNTPASPWLIAGVIVSVIAGVVQARRIAIHRQFNHNDFFHVIQIGALYLFYRGGVLLVDR